MLVVALDGWMESWQFSMSGSCEPMTLILARSFRVWGVSSASRRGTLQLAHLVMKLTNRLQNKIHLQPAAKSAASRLMVLPWSQECSWHLSPFREKRLQEQHWHYKLNIWTSHLSHWTGNLLKRANVQKFSIIFYKAIGRTYGGRYLHVLLVMRPWSLGQYIDIYLVSWHHLYLLRCVVPW